MIAPIPPHGSPRPSATDPRADSEPRPDPQALEAEIAELAAHIDAARYRLLVRLGEFEALGAWGIGFKSCAHWLSWRISITLGAAREYLRVARALPQLPLLSAAMERGEISFSKTRALTRVATPANEERLLEFASVATAMQLERLVRAWDTVERLNDDQLRHERRGLTLYVDADGSYVIRGRLDPEVGETVRAAVERARTQLYREGEERTRLETTPYQRAADAIGLVAEWALGSSVLAESNEAAGGPVAKERREGGAAAAAEALEAEGAAGRGDGPPVEGADGKGGGLGNGQRTPEVRGPEDSGEGDGNEGGAEDVGDAEVNESRGAGESQTRCCSNVGPAAEAEHGKRPARPRTANRSDRFLVVLHVDQDGLRASGKAPSSGAQSGAAVLEGKGKGVCAATARRIACDGSLVVMTHDAEGNVLDVGRKRRTIPPAIRRALDHRDGGCRFPGCGSKYVDHHHVRHWIDGGETKVTNILQTCRRHHRLLHEGGFSVELSEDGEVRFYRPDGRLVPNVPPLPPVKEDAEARLRRENEARGIEIGPWTATPDWHGERFDLHYGLWTLYGQYADDPYADDRVRDDPNPQSDDPDAGDHPGGG